MATNPNPILKQAKQQVATTKQATATPESATALAISPTAPTSSSLEAVQKGLVQSTTRITSSIEALEQSAKETTLSTDAIVSAITDLTAAKQITAQAEGAANLQAQNSILDVFEAGGGLEIQTQLAADLRADGKRVADLLDQKADIVDDEHTGIGVLDAAINRIRAFQTNVELSVARRQQTQTQTQIANFAASTESFARVNALTKKTLNAGTIEAQYKTIEAEGRIAGAKAELVNFNSNATALTNLMAADARNVANLTSVFRLEGEQQQREIQVERVAFQREQMHFQKEQWKVQGPAAKVAFEQATLNLERSKNLTPVQIATAEQNLAAANKRFNDQIATEDTLVSTVQRAQALLEGEGNVEARETIIFGLTRGGVAGAKYDKLLDIGSAENMVLGANPFEAKLSLQTASPSGNFAANVGTALLNHITLKQADKYKEAGAGVPRDEATLANDFNTTATEVMKDFANDIRTGDASNPYHAPPMTVLSQSQAVQQSELYKNVLEAKQMKETNPQTILDAAIAAIRAGTISPESAAVGIANLFEVAGDYNNTLNGGFDRVGLPNQTSYNTTIQAPASFLESLKIATPVLSIAPLVTALDFAKRSLAGEDVGLNTPVKVDMSDKTQVQAAIIRVLSSLPPAQQSPNNSGE